MRDDEAVRRYALEAARQKLKEILDLFPELAGEVKPAKRRGRPPKAAAAAVSKSEKLRKRWAERKAAKRREEEEEETTH